MTAGKSLPGLISKLARHAYNNASKDGLLSGRRAAIAMGHAAAAATGSSSSTVQGFSSVSWLQGAARMASSRGLVAAPMGTAALLGHQMATAKPQIPTCNVPAISTSACAVDESNSNGSSGGLVSESSAGESDDEGVSHKGPKSKKRKPQKPPYGRSSSSSTSSGSDPYLCHPHSQKTCSFSQSGLLPSFLVTPNSVQAAAPPLVRRISCTARLDGPAAAAAVAARAVHNAHPRQVHSSDSSQWPERRTPPVQFASTQQAQQVQQGSKEDTTAHETKATDSGVTKDQVQEFLDTHHVRVHAPAGYSVPEPVLSLEAAPFPPKLIRMLTRAGYQQPTPIQSQAWPIAQDGSNMVAIASTGSGKTVAFLLPALASIYTGKLAATGLGGAHTPTRYMSHKHRQKAPLVLVLAPTRELAHQIQGQASLFGGPLGIDSIALYGGVSKVAHVRALRTSQPQVVVATPGRLLDLLDMQVLTLDQVQYLVLDEADCMLDMGFEEDIRAILKHLPPPDQRQALFFSATWPKEVRSLAGSIAGRDAVSVFIGNISDQPVAAHTITQQVQLVRGKDGKLTALKAYLQQLMQEHAAAEAAAGQQPHDAHQLGRHRHKALTKPAVEPLRVIVFVSTKVMAEMMEDWFYRQRDLPQAVFVHGERSQYQRASALRRFRSGDASVMVATDVAARGLDIPHVTAVVNFDVPRAGRSEDYVHRIGRTGRAGATGRSLALLDKGSDSDAKFAEELIKIMREAGQEVSEELESFADSARSGGHGRRGGFNSSHKRGRYSGSHWEGRGHSYRRGNDSHGYKGRSSRGHDSHDYYERSTRGSYRERAGWSDSD